MKKIIFLLCVFVFFVTLYSLKESFELLPLEPENTNAKNNLNIKLPTQVDRVKCEDESYKYCYNGDITKKDIFGNTFTIEETDPYNYGKTYSDICYQKVYLEDYTQNLKGSSKTRDVFYDPYNICNLNYPWHLKLPIETTKTNECTSTKDIENYDKCIGYETPCKNKDIQLKTNETYTEYNCSDNAEVATSLEGTDAKISIPDGITESNTIQIGTYEDTWRRGLNVYKGRTNSSGQIYDVKTCSKECNNYNYFGLQNGEKGNPECWCGDSLTDATRYGPIGCDEKVGGAWCNSIYKNVCSFISDGIITTSDVCTISGENRELIYDVNYVSKLCKQQNCTTESYPDMSQCYSDESVASYQHDVYYFDLKNVSKYPFEVPPSNPKEAIINNDNLVNKVKIKSPQIDYSVSACSMDKPLYANDKCHSLSDNVVDLSCNETFPYLLNGLCVDSDTAINDVSNSCTKKKPYKYNNECYATIELAENTEFILDSSNENGICFLKDITTGKVDDTGISCENLYGVSDLDNSMLYNPITNNFVGQLEAGDYSYIDCSGMLTKCLSSFPYEKNSNDELVPIYEELNELQRDKIPEYPKPPPYKEPPISKYINPYNSDLHSNLFIQCKNDYNNVPQEIMCPKELPICKGYVENEQFGFCNDTLDKTQQVGAYNINHLSCKNDYSKIPKPDMCPYNLPYCEDNICKESSLFYDRG